MPDQEEIPFTQNLISYEDDPYYSPEINAETLMQEIEEDKIPLKKYFNNLHLHIIDPAYTENDDEKFRVDFVEIQKKAEEKYWNKIHPDIQFSDSLLKEVRRNGVTKEQYMVLADIYIKMRNKGYPRYTPNTKETCLIR